jgi:hypothetical protein
MERVEKLGLAGLIADVEDAPAWLGHLDDVQALGEALRYAAKHYSIGFTSFPSWPYVGELATVVANTTIWGSPQLYGVRDPGAANVVAGRGQGWRNAFGPARYMPSIAAWSRSAQEQQAYLQAFNQEFSAIMWLSPAVPAVGSPLFNVLRNWYPQGRRPLDGRELFSVAAANFLRPITLPRFT